MLTLSAETEYIPIPGSEAVLNCEVQVRKARSKCVDAWQDFLRLECGVTVFDATRSVNVSRINSTAIPKVEHPKQNWRKFLSHRRDRTAQAMRVSGVRASWNVPRSTGVPGVLTS
jgi:hypothetical protein